MPQTIITSDCAPVAGLPSGHYEAFGTTVHVDGPCVRTADRAYLAGSGALMIDCMNHLASLGLKVHAPNERLRRLELADLIELSFGNPLRAIGICPDTMRDEWAARVPPCVEYCHDGRFRLLNNHAEPGGGGCRRGD